MALAGLYLAVEEGFSFLIALPSFRPAGWAGREGGEGVHLSVATAAGNSVFLCLSAKKKLLT